MNSKALSDGGWEINPKYLKKISEGEGELEYYIKKPDFHVKTVHLQWGRKEKNSSSRPYNSFIK